MVQSATHFKIWQIAKKNLEPVFPPDKRTFHKDWLKWDENCGSSCLLKILKIGNFAKCTEWPQTELKEPTTKSTLHNFLYPPRVRHFHPLYSIINPFQDIGDFRTFLLTPMFKFQSATNC